MLQEATQDLAGAMSPAVRNVLLDRAATSGIPRYLGAYRQPARERRTRTARWGSGTMALIALLMPLTTRRISRSGWSRGPSSGPDSELPRAWSTIDWCSRLYSDDSRAGENGEERVHRHRFPDTSRRRKGGAPGLRFRAAGVVAPGKSAVGFVVGGRNRFSTSDSR